MSRFDSFKRMIEVLDISYKCFESFLQDHFTDGEIHAFFEELHEFSDSLEFFRKWADSSSIKYFVYVHLGLNIFTPVEYTQVKSVYLSDPNKIMQLQSILRTYEQLVEKYTDTVIEFVIEHEWPSRVLEDFTDFLQYVCVCKKCVLPNCECEKVIYVYNVQQRLESVSKIQQWFRRRQFLIKNRTFVEVISVPAKHESVLGKLFQMVETFTIKLTNILKAT
jgi:hypothetical protein